MNFADESAAKVVVRVIRALQKAPGPRLQLGVHVPGS